MVRLNMISETEFTVKGHGVHTAYVEITEALKKNPRVQVEVNGRGKYDIVHIQTMGLYALRWLVNPRVKKVVSAHLVPDSFLGSIRWANRWKPAAETYLKWFYGKADLVLACSGSVKKELTEDMGLTKVDVLYNSIKMSRYDHSPEDKLKARKLLNIPEDKVLIIGNGQIQPRKRFDLFCQMAEQRPDYLFYWVGGIPFGILGAEAEKMQQTIKNAPANLLVSGIIPLEQVLYYYQAADIFTLPATQENHPMCVLEAAGAGLPIVLRDIFNYQDTFKGGAILAKEDGDFIKAIDELATNPAYYKEWQEKSRLIRDRFDSENSADRLIDFYEKVLGE